MYCINKTERHSTNVLARGCHALQWFEDKERKYIYHFTSLYFVFSLQVGCHSDEEDGVSIIQCVCSQDFCNGPTSALEVSLSTNTQSSCVNTVALGLVSILLTDRRGKISYE